MQFGNHNLHTSNKELRNRINEWLIIILIILIYDLKCFQLLTNINICLRKAKQSFCNLIIHILIILSYWNLYSFQTICLLNILRNWNNCLLIINRIHLHSQNHIFYLRKLKYSLRNVHTPLISELIFEPAKYKNLQFLTIFYQLLRKCLRHLLTTLVLSNIALQYFKLGLILKAQRQLEHYFLIKLTILQRYF